MSEALLRSVSITATLWAIGALEPCFSQERPAEAPNKYAAASNFPFSLSKYEDVQRLRAVRNLAATEATRVLEKRRRGEFTDEHDEPARAVEVLWMLRCADQKALVALCDNITMESITAGEAIPLDGFLAANALIAIGGPRVREAVLDSIHKQLDRKGLLIRAHVLAKLDPASIAREHLRLALEDQEHREKINAIAVNETYKSNLRLMDEWLNDPQFLADIKNWP